MGRKAKFSDGLTHTAEAMIAGAATVRELKAGMSVVLAAKAGLSDAAIAEILCVGTATVSRLRNEVRQFDAGSAANRPSHGGRRHEILSVEEEARFLDPWTVEAEKGGVLVVPPVHAALEKRVGHKVAKSTVYRILARHGWRKIAPDNAHPKRDAAAQEEFKKGASRRIWRRP